MDRPASALAPPREPEELASLEAMVDAWLAQRFAPRRLNLGLVGALVISAAFWTFIALLGYELLK